MKFKVERSGDIRKHFEVNKGVQLCMCVFKYEQEYIINRVESIERTYSLR